jgi:hypothetical protein
MAKSKRQLADEAYMRSMETLSGAVPVEPGVLVGQLTIEGTVEGTNGREELHPIKGAPRHCPGCTADMLVVYGGSWTPMWTKTDDATDLPLAGEITRLQCGKCSYVVVVAHATWLEVKAERRRTVGRRDAPPPKREKKKTRGAG